MLARDYQIQGINQICTEWTKGNTSVLYVLPTGGGKTFIFTELAKTFAEHFLPVVVLANRIDLVSQTAAKISECGIEPGIVQGNHRIKRDRIIQVASIQSLIRRELPPAQFLIFDEAHLLPAKSHKLIWEMYPDIPKLAVTATPLREDGVGFERLCNVLVEGPSTAELIDWEYLSPYRLIAHPPVGKKVVMGDIVSTWMKYCYGQLTFVFCPDCATSEAIADLYNANGIPAAHVDGTMSKTQRQDIYEKFKHREKLILTNSNLLVEGIDIPQLECIQNLTNIGSSTRWLQICGRVLRYVPGKIATIIDHTVSWVKHGLPDDKRHWSLYAEDKNSLITSKVSLRQRRDAIRIGSTYLPNIELIEINTVIPHKQQIDYFNEIRIKANMQPDWLIYRLEGLSNISEFSFGDWRYISNLIANSHDWAYKSWLKHSASQIVA